MRLCDRIRPATEDDLAMKTAKGQEALEIAWMLVCFHELGAFLTPPLLDWARNLVRFNP